MPRRRDLPCARCGELMWRGTGVLPEGEATCRPCRREASSPAQERPQPVTAWTCQHCGVECTRPPTRGQIPKWCGQQCADMSKKAQAGICAHCGIDYVGHGARFCSKGCSASYGNSRRERQRRPAPIKTLAPRKDVRSALRKAYEMGDRVGILSAIKDKCMVSDSGCWIWQGNLKSGYPTLRFGTTNLQAHRVSLEASLGAPLGSQAAHHKCATTACVNPEHLQPVTHRENIAEMLARQAYINRIRELEQALADLTPDHPLLATIAVA